MCSAHVVSAISRGRSMHMREWTIVSGMEASASAGFGLRDVHVKTNGCFWSSMNAIHECVRISAAAARRRVEASTRETLISVRHFPPRHSVCTSNLAVVFGVSSVGRVHVKLDRRFRHVCPFFSLYVAAKMLHMSKFGRRFRHAPILAVCQGGIKSFTPFARHTSYAKC